MRYVMVTASGQGHLLSRAGHVGMGLMEKLDLGTVYWKQGTGVDLWLPARRRELGPSALHSAASLAVTWEARSYGL